MKQQICFCCEIKKYSLQKRQDPEFFLERKNEFYPDEEFGPFAGVCPDCDEELIEYYLNK